MSFFTCLAVQQDLVAALLSMCRNHRSPRHAGPWSSPCIFWTWMWLYSWTHCHCIQRSQSAPERGRGRPWKSLLLQT